MVENLPPANAKARDDHGPWGDLERILHSIDTQLRNLNASYYNTHKKKSDPAVEPHPLPTPEQREAKVDYRTPEQVSAERAHLQSVLSRKKPT